MISVAKVALPLWRILHGLTGRTALPFSRPYGPTKKISFPKAQKPARMSPVFEWKSKGSGPSDATQTFADGL